MRKGCITNPWHPTGLCSTGQGLVRSLAAFIGLVCLLHNAAFAQSCPITLTINASNPGVAISPNFVGLSVASQSIDGDSGYTKCFTTANTQMVNLFKQIGIKHVRTIMGKATSSNPDPSNSQIDSFFDLAAASGVNKIIWSLHLYNTETTNIWSNKPRRRQPYLDYHNKQRHRGKKLA